MTDDDTEFRSRFPIAVDLPVQWGDQDSFGHVNNVVFLRWFESSRIAYLTSCGIEVSAAKVGPILAAVNCNFTSQLRYPDTVVVGTVLDKLGNTSITVAHEVFSMTQAVVVANGTSVIVNFDYELQTSVPIADRLRETLLNH